MSKLMPMCSEAVQAHINGLAALVCPALFRAPHRDVSILNSGDKPLLLLVYSNWKPLLEKKHGKAGLGGQVLNCF